MKKDTESTLRELQAKMETYRVKIARVEQEIIDQQTQVNKFIRYQERAYQPEQKQRFALQQQASESEVRQLEQKKQQLQDQLVPYQNSFHQIDNELSETVTHLQLLEKEAQTKQQQADLSLRLHDYEDKVRRQLAEAEALLELRNPR